MTDARDDLIHKHILYPATVCNTINHIHFAANFQRSYSRGLLQEFEKDPAQFAANLDKQVRIFKEELTAYSPEIFLISAEYFFRLNMKAARNMHIFDWLRDISQTIHIVAYIRKPSDAYVSGVQQFIKASSHLPPPGYKIRGRLEYWSELFPGALKIRPFEKIQLAGGDIVNDFAQTFIPQASELLQSRSQRVNETLSAESIALLQSFRREKFHDADGQFNAETNQLVRMMAKMESKVPGFSRPRLHDRIKNAIDRASYDLLWLRDEFGVTYSNVDYSQISEHELDLGNVANVEDICEVDAKRLRRLRKIVF